MFLCEQHKVNALKILKCSIHLHVLLGALVFFTRYLLYRAPDLWQAWSKGHGVIVHVNLDIYLLLDISIFHLSSSFMNIKLKYKVVVIFKSVLIGTFDKN